jgi:putative transposase
MGRRLDDVRLAVLMVDGIDLKGRINVVALAITTEGVKLPLGLWEGSTENAAVATALLSDLVDRGLDVEQGVLCVLDGSKALRKAVRDVLGVSTPVQRCVRHEECHEGVPSAGGASLDRRQASERRATCSSSLGSIGRRGGRAGARSAPRARSSMRDGRRPMSTASRCSSRA